MEKTVSYVGKDLSNALSAIIHLATPGSLETIVNNTYLNCFHSLCPGGLEPSTQPHPIFLMTNESWESLCFVWDHTTGWAFQTHPCPLLSQAAAQTFHHTASNMSVHHLLGLGVSIFLRPHLCFEIHPLFYSQLDGRDCEGAILLLVSPVLAHPLSQTNLSCLRVLQIRNNVLLPFGFSYFLPNALPKCSLNPSYHAVPQFC